MTGYWTVRCGLVTCGYDGHDVPADTPVYVLGGSRTPRYRCEFHAPRPVDPEQVASARQVIAQAKQREFHRILASGDIRGVHTARGPRPFHEVADDPVIARLCAEDNR